MLRNWLLATVLSSLVLTTRTFGAGAAIPAGSGQSFCGTVLSQLRDESWIDSAFSQEIARIRARGTPLEQSLQIAYRRFPNDPHKRAQELIRLLQRYGDFRPSTGPWIAGSDAIRATDRRGAPWWQTVVPVDESGRPQYRGQPFKNLSVHVTADGTARIVNGEVRGNVWIPPEGADVVLVFLPGAGADFSNVGAFMRLGSDITKLNDTPSESRKNKPSFQEKVRAAIGATFSKTAVVLLDLPGQGLGRNPAEFPTLRQTTDFIGNEIRNIREALPGLPVIAAGRSAGAAFWPQAIAEDNMLVDGLVMISPLHPSSAHGFDRSYLKVLDLYEAESGLANWPSLQFVNKQCREMDWYQRDNLFFTTPLAIMIGGKDGEVGPEAYREFRRLAETSPYGTQGFSVFTRAEHDVFANRDSETAETAIEAYHALYQFMQFVRQRSVMER